MQSQQATRHTPNASTHRTGADGTGPTWQPSAKGSADTNSAHTGHLARIAPEKSAPRPPPGIRLAERYAQRYNTTVEIALRIGLEIGIIPHGEEFLRAMLNDPNP